MLYGFLVFGIFFGFFVLKFWGDRLNNGGRPGRLERFFDE